MTEPLPVVVDSDEALKPGAPILHEQEAKQGFHRGFDEDIERDHPNVCSKAVQKVGDIAAAFEGAAFVLEGEYRYPNSYAYAMEPYNSMAEWRDGGIDRKRTQLLYFLYWGEEQRIAARPDARPAPPQHSLTGLSARATLGTPCALTFGARPGWGPPRGNSRAEPACSPGPMWARRCRPW